MELLFTKMNGAGNDFVVVDNRDNSLTADLTKTNIALLCNRQRGIGADGLLAVETVEDHPEARYRMRYYNADGGEAEMCGNGARCFFAFLAKLINHNSTEPISFLTQAGVLQGKFVSLPSSTYLAEVEIQMSEPTDYRGDIQLEIDGKTTTVDHWNTGVPHVVEIVEALAEVDLLHRGNCLRFHPEFQPAGANVNFQEVIQPGFISVRTYERGVENETLACGTGVVANALIHASKYDLPSPIKVQVAGGEILQVHWETTPSSPFTKVRLQGPAATTFTGTICLKEQ